MWIRMLRDQVTPWGPLQKGQRHEVTPEMAKKLADDSYEVIARDEKEIERMGVEERRKHLAGELAVIGASINSAKERLADIEKRRKMVADKLEKLTAVADAPDRAAPGGRDEETKDDGKSEPAGPAAGPAAKDNRRVAKR